jgi:hypothetical protein
MANKNGKKSNGSGAQGFEAQVATILTGVSALTASVKALGLPVLTDGERTHTMGKLRVGEAAAILGVFDTVDAFPQYFESLSDKDGGSDPNVVETQPARTALASSGALEPVVTALTQLQQMVSDGMIGNGEKAKELSVPAYAIGKAISGTNTKVRASMAPALTFYGSPARKRVAATKRATNATAKAAKKGKASGSAGA